MESISTRKSDLHRKGTYETGGDVFGHVVCRVGGLPTDVFEEMRGKELIETFDHLEEVRGGLEEHQSEAHDLLYDAVGNADDEHRGAYLGIKRDVYNGRELDEGDLSVASETWSDEVESAIEKYQKLRSRAEKTQSELWDIYGQKLKEARETLREWVREEDFQNGLLLSSKSLFSAQSHYLEAGGKDLSGNQRSIERGLLRYLSRTAMKATPFGTFCGVLQGELGQFEGEGLVEISGSPMEKETKIRLNKRIYGLLKAHLQERNSIRQNLEVDINPTLRFEKGGVRFLTNQGGEVFQRMDENPVLKWI